MTPAILVGNVQNATTNLMEAYEKLKALYETHTDLGSTYTEQYFTDNPDLPINFSDFGTLLYNLAESTPSVFSQIEAGGLYYNKARTR